jgi:hypothetical protein
MQRLPRQPSNARLARILLWNRANPGDFENRLLGATNYRRAVVVGLLLGTAHVRSYRRRLVRKTPLANTSLPTRCGFDPGMRDATAASDLLKPNDARQTYRFSISTLAAYSIR